VGAHRQPQFETHRERQGARSMNTLLNVLKVIENRDTLIDFLTIVKLVATIIDRHKQGDSNADDTAK
jgi:hypothetical protein